MPELAATILAQRSIMRSFFKFMAANVAGAVILVLFALAWLWLDSRRIKDDFFSERKGTLSSSTPSQTPGDAFDHSGLVRLESDSGLAVRFRVLRAKDASEPLPVLLVLGGHRTGSRAVELVGDPGPFAMVMLDYPYDGPQSIHGLAKTLRYLPRIRSALLDIPPAISLTVDWLQQQPWADAERIVMIGVSLGAPFAATAADLDQRLSALWLAHGAADNRLWLQANLARRIEGELLQSLAATVLIWIANGPTFDTAARVSAMSPRPVLIIGARADERTPAGQTEQLYAAASEPKSLRWTEGMHIEPGRRGVIDALLAIAREQLATDIDQQARGAGE